MLWKNIYPLLKLYNCLRVHSIGDKYSKYSYIYFRTSSFVFDCASICVYICVRTLIYVVIIKTYSNTFIRIQTDELTTWLTHSLTHLLIRSLIHLLFHIPTQTVPQIRDINSLTIRVLSSPLALSFTHTFYFLLSLAIPSYLNHSFSLHCFPCHILHNSLSIHNNIHYLIRYNTNWNLIIIVWVEEFWRK